MLSMPSTFSRAAQTPALAPTTHVGASYPTVSAAHRPLPALVSTMPLRQFAVHPEAIATTYRPSFVT